jgi:hypothetical protein
MQAKSLCAILGPMRRKGDSHLLPERPFACFAQKVAVTFSSHNHAWSFCPSACPRDPILPKYGHVRGGAKRDEIRCHQREIPSVGDRAGSRVCGDRNRPTVRSPGGLVVGAHRRRLPVLAHSPSAEVGPDGQRDPSGGCRLFCGRLASLPMASFWPRRTGAVRTSGRGAGMPGGCGVKRSPTSPRAPARPNADHSPRGPYPARG